MRLRRSRLGLAGTAALLVPLVLIACTATPPDEPAADSDVRLPPGPSVEFEGEIDAWSVAMVDCLVDAGWDARLDGEPGEGGLYVEDPGPAQEDQYRADLTECLTVKVGEPVEISSEADLRDRYDRLVEQTACLQEAGYPISEPPSYQSYRDAFEAQGDTSSFWPLGEIGGEDGRIAASQCPFSPW